jgi:hypothetical protein
MWLMLERGWNYGVHVLGHAHQRRLHGVVVVQQLPAAETVTLSYHQIVLYLYHGLF